MQLSGCRRTTSPISPEYTVPFTTEDRCHARGRSTPHVCISRCLLEAIKIGPNLAEYGFVRIGHVPQKDRRWTCSQPLICPDCRSNMQFRLVSRTYYASPQLGGYLCDYLGHLSVVCNCQELPQEGSDSDVEGLSPFWLATSGTD